MELTPRTSAESDRPTGRRRSLLAYGVLVVVAVGLGVVVWQGLTSASLYFYNADEAVAERDELGDRRIRLQGTVLAGTVQPTDDGVDFAVEFNDVRVDVRHAGDPPELFEPGIPVVVEGRWSEDAFASDTIRVKHSEEYEADYGDRLDDAGDGTSAGASATGAGSDA